ncbi:MAG: hypothetical protein MPEBLZ_03560 [Candidatus Methanoperedens nitroreducens]|uniref:Uncharacterized protein n=1 Tax=Candidatus Methanoperedens nitratireducens TaxID=1392998 RepID=A0A0N8KQE0_9EURY|nr:MAG: hypothetical protein MPEBLZ_03560 [Candidatus Methanoperedens sp. BLZ1]CAG0978549.1 hypothetical protein METP2_01824 [Methanosarcinales archaeon]
MKVKYSKLPQNPQFAYISFELEIRSSLYDNYDIVISILLYIFASDNVSDKCHTSGVQKAYTCMRFDELV